MRSAILIPTVCRAWPLSRPLLLLPRSTRAGQFKSARYRVRHPPPLVGVACAFASWRAVASRDNPRAACHVCGAHTYPGGTRQDDALETGTMGGRGRELGVGSRLAHLRTSALAGDDSSRGRDIYNIIYYQISSMPNISLSNCYNRCTCSLPIAGVGGQPAIRQHARGHTVRLRKHVVSAPAPLVYQDLG